MSDNRITWGWHSNVSFSNFNSTLILLLSFQPGDQLTLSIVARSKSSSSSSATSSLTSRHEVFVEVEEPHSNPFVPPATTPRAAAPASNGSTATPAESATTSGIVMKGLEDELEEERRREAEAVEGDKDEKEQA